MLGPPKPRRLSEPIAVSLEDLVPRDNFYRRLETKLDLDEELPDHSSLTRVRQRLGIDVFQRILAATGWGRRHAPCGSLVTLPREPGRLLVLSV